MEADYEEYDRSKQEFDPFQNVKPSSGSTNGAREPFKGVSHSQQPQRPTAFSRDFLDSLCTVVNRDLLFCKLFYFFFFGAFGSLFPLLAIYFKQLGMNASQSGVLIGFRPFIEFLSSPFWGGLADKWKRGKEMLLFSLVCWIVFTLAIAFVKPPAHKCITFNGTHNLLEVPLGRRRRDDASAIHRFSVDLTPMSVSHLGGFKVLGSDFRLLNPPPLLSKTTTLSVADSIQDPRLAHNSGWAKDVIVLPDDLEVIDINSRYRRSPVVDPSKIANVNGSMRGLIFNRHSTVVYQEDEVSQAFFILLLLVIIGEFFSAPAITFADSVTLSFLGEDTQNYGRQRMFGSLGWGLAMFFVGMALDHSTTFPDHPCGKAHLSEKNYTVCFAVFSVLMSCAFLAALQFRFDHHLNRKLKLSEIPVKVKDKVKRVISGHRKIDRERLVEEYDEDDEEFPRKPLEDAVAEDSAESNLKINPAAGSDMVTDALKAPGAKAGRGLGGATGAIPFGSAEANYSDQPFFGKWIAVVKLLATYQYISVLFIAWFMGFGIGIIFTFLFWHLQDLGGSPTLFGVASVINHISELFAYFMAGNLILKFGHVKILYAGLLGNIARFFYISFLSNPWWVLPFEFVQGLTHAAVWASCCAYITHAIPVELRSSAQGILQGLHHGLGRGCGAVFGGLLVYQYGSIVTFRIYGVTCIMVLLAYVGINVFLEKRGKFSHGGKVPHELFEDTAHLAPHGVPSGMARNLSNTRLAKDVKQEYGSVTNDNGSSFAVQGQRDGQLRTSSRRQEENPLHQGYEGDRITMFEPPRLPTHIYQQQPKNSYDQDYGP
nr:major facilitator superfamily domain-containing protein 6-like [Biomphalaria glabrata]